jgi:hypothetical protein
MYREQMGKFVHVTEPASRSAARQAFERQRHAYDADDELANAIKLVT